MSPTATYRVELRQPRRRRLLGLVTTASPHFRALDPYVSRMLHDGQQGLVVLVNAATGEVVARRQLRTTHR